MREVLPGIQHWTVHYEKIKVEVSSYYLPQQKIVLDPLLPPGEIDPFPAGVEHVLLTNRHHYRDSGKLVQRYGCAVWCVQEGMHEFAGGEPVQAFRFGDTLAGGIRAFEIGGICPDETALVLPPSAGVVALADGVIRWGDGPLTFVPDEHLGEDPEAAKQALRTAYARLLEEHTFDHLLLAHGDPWIGGGQQALERFVAGS